MFEKAGIVKEGAALEQGIAVDQRLVDAQHRRIVRTVFGAIEIGGVVEAESGEMLGECRLVAQDGLFVGGLGLQRPPIGAKRRRTRHVSSHGEKIGVDMIVQRSKTGQRIWRHRRMRCDAPEIAGPPLHRAEQFGQRE